MLIKDSILAHPHQKSKRFRLHSITVLKFFHYPRSVKLPIFLSKKELFDKCTFPKHLKLFDCNSFQVIAI